MYSFQANENFHEENNDRSSTSDLNSSKYQNQNSKGLHDSYDLVNNSLVIVQNTSFSMFETRKYTPKRNSLLKTKKTIASTTNNSSFLSKKTDINKEKDNAKGLNNEGNNSFSCPYCIKKRSRSCALCLGTQKIKNDCALINFFSFIVQYKLGVVQSYTPQQKQKIQKPSRLSQNSKISKLEKLTILERKNQFQNIHYGYYCNLCNNSTPIEGSRFTCVKCQDFDLCKKCYKYQGHEHMMKQIETSPNYRSSMRCLQRMSINNQKFNNQIRKTHDRIGKLQQKFFSSSIQ